MSILYISPVGSGTHDGSSPANAGTIYNLPKFIAAAGAGDKSDTINNGDTGTSPDVLQFKAGIMEDQLWFAKNGNDLLVTLRGTGNTDSVRVKGWYSATSNQLSRFQLSDGMVLEASRVQQLVQAMSAFTSSSGTPATMTTAQAQSVETTIAANWHSTT